MKRKKQSEIILVEVPKFKKQEYPTTEKLAELYYDIVESMNITLDNLGDLDRVYKEYSMSNFFFLLEVSKKVIEILCVLDDSDARKIASKHEGAIYRFKNTKMEPDKGARVCEVVKALFDDTMLYFSTRK